MTNKISSILTGLPHAELTRYYAQYQTILKGVQNPPSFEEWVVICLKSGERKRVIFTKSWPSYAEQRNHHKM